MHKTPKTSCNNEAMSSTSTAFLFVAGLLASLAEANANVIPYGLSEGDQQIDFSQSPSATALRVPVDYCKRHFSEIYISSQGVVSIPPVVSFGGPYAGPSADRDREITSFIAVFSSSATGGTVYYRTRQRASPLSKEISRMVRKAYADSPGFDSVNTMLISWENLQSDEQDGLNLFQLALATDSRSSYAILLYHNVDWTRSNGSVAQAGFFCEGGRSEELLNSGTDEMRLLPRLTNCGESGTFVYRISGGEGNLPQSSGACDVGRHSCIEANMICVPTDVDYRCECTAGFHQQADRTAASGFRCAVKNHRLGCGSGNSREREDGSGGRRCRHRRGKGDQAQSNKRGQDPNVPGPSGHGQAGSADPQAPAKKPQFEDPPLKVTDSQRLFPIRTSGYAPAEETYAKQCSVPHDGLRNLGACVSNSCVLTAAAKFLSNAGCFKDEIRQCYENAHVAKCSSDEVRLVYNLLTKPNGLAEYMAAHNLKPGDFQSEEQIIIKLLVLLSRADVLAGTRNQLGYRLSLKTRHQVQGDNQQFSYMPFEPVMREGAHGTDFSHGNDLLDAVFAGSEDHFIPSDRFSDQFLSFLTKKPGQRHNYFKNKKMTLHAHLHGHGAQATRIPRHVVRLFFRFDWATFGTKMRTVPEYLENNNRKFHLHATIAVTEDTGHLYVFALKWKSREQHECWFLDALKEPELLTGDAKKRCVDERIMWTVFAVRGPDMP